MKNFFFLLLIVIFVSSCTSFYKPVGKALSAQEISNLQGYASPENKLFITPDVIELSPGELKNVTVRLRGGTLVYKKAFFGRSGSNWKQINFSQASAGSSGWIVAEGDEANLTLEVNDDFPAGRVYVIAVSCTSVAGGYDCGGSQINRGLWIIQAFDVSRRGVPGITINSPLSTPDYSMKIVCSPYVTDCIVNSAMTGEFEVLYDISSDSPLDTCWFTVNNGLNNYSLVVDDSRLGAKISYRFRPVYNQGVLTYPAKFWCNGTNGLSNGTQMVNFRVSPPVNPTDFNLISPSSGRSYSYGEIIDFNLSSVDNALKSCTLTLDGVTQNMNFNSTRTLAYYRPSQISSGTKSATITCKDFLDKVTTKQVNFEVAAADPDSAEAFCVAPNTWFPNSATEKCCGNDPQEVVVSGLGDDTSVACCPSNSYFSDNGECYLFDQGVCSDGTKNTNEACDGNEFGGINCQTFGYTGGNIACTSDCEFNLASCTPQNTPLQIPADVVANPQLYVSVGSKLGYDICFDSKNYAETWGNSDGTSYSYWVSTISSDTSQALVTRSGGRSYPNAIWSVGKTSSAAVDITCNPTSGLIMSTKIMQFITEGNDYTIYPDQRYSGQGNTPPIQCNPVEVIDANTKRVSYSKISPYTSWENTTVYNGAGTENKFRYLCRIGQHSADYNKDWVIDATEFNRVNSYFNAGGYYCNPAGYDGYAAGIGSHDCTPHSADYKRAIASDFRDMSDWVIDSTELSRVRNYWQSGGYIINKTSNDLYSNCSGCEWGCFSGACKIR